MKFKIAEELSDFNFGSEFVNAGRAHEKGVAEKDVDAKELEMGIAVEHEHTTNKDIAKRIALDHLAEIKDYYTRLAKMEEKGKKAQEESKEEDKDEEEDEEKDEDKDESEEEDEEDEEDEKKDKGSSLKV